MSCVGRIVLSQLCCFRGSWPYALGPIVPGKQAHSNKLQRSPITGTRLIKHQVAGLPLSCQRFPCRAQAIHTIGRIRGIKGIKAPGLGSSTPLNATKAKAAPAPAKIPKNRTIEKSPAIKNWVLGMRPSKENNSHLSQEIPDRGSAGAVAPLEVVVGFKVTVPFLLADAVVLRRTIAGLPATCNCAGALSRVCHRWWNTRRLLSGEWYWER